MRRNHFRTFAWLSLFALALIGIAFAADEGARREAARIEAQP